MVWEYVYDKSPVALDLNYHPQGDVPNRSLWITHHSPKGSCLVVGTKGTSQGGWCRKGGNGKEVWGWGPEQTECYKSHVNFERLICKHNARQFYGLPTGMCVWGCGTRVCWLILHTPLPPALLLLHGIHLWLWISLHWKGLLLPLSGVKLDDDSSLHPPIQPPFYPLMPHYKTPLLCRRRNTRSLFPLSKTWLADPKPGVLPALWFQRDVRDIWDVSSSQVAKKSNIPPF